MWFDPLRDLGAGHRYAPGWEPSILEKVFNDLLQNGFEPIHLFWVLPIVYLVSGLTGSNRAVRWSRRRY
ncbi:MAG: hypothetical protein AAGC57_00375 [Pseudomonadota bacterium]